MPESRKPGNRFWFYGVPAVALLAGFLFATSAEASQGFDLRGGHRTELTDLIEEEQRRVVAAEERVAELRDSINKAGIRAHDRAVKRAHQRTERLAESAGLQPVHGPGVRVTLDDAPPLESTGDYPGRPSPNDLVVHQEDVQGVVNALWAGGAEAMRIMDQRVISTSAVRCVGNTLILQGVVYSPPFRITAIGDPERLQAALDRSPEVRLYRQYVAAYGLKYEVTTFENVRVPGYSGAADLRYANVPQA